MTRDEVIALAQRALENREAHDYDMAIISLAEGVLAMHEELERLGWSAMKLECKGDELCVEVQSLRAELQSMRAVVEAAEAWIDYDGDDDWKPQKHLLDAVDALRAAREGKP